MTAAIQTWLAYKNGRELAPVTERPTTACPRCGRANKWEDLWLGRHQTLRVAGWRCWACGATARLVGDPSLPVDPSPKLLAALARARPADCKRHFDGSHGGNTLYGVFAPHRGDVVYVGSRFFTIEDPAHDFFASKSYRSTVLAMAGASELCEIQYGPGKFGGFAQHNLPGEGDLVFLPPLESQV